MKKQFPSFITFSVCMCLFLFGTGVAKQGRGAIKGVVIDAETHLTLPYTNITIMGTQMGSAADHKGQFNIQSVQIGQIQVKASHVGYQAQVKTVEVSPGTVIEVLFELHEDMLQTQHVVVTATRTPKLM
jgi:hypothetical protein